MVKIGDLVTPSKGTRSLSPIPFSKLGSRIEKWIQIPFEMGEVGTVLELESEDEIYYGKRSMRILVPQGIGWCLEDWIEVVNESR